MTGTSLLLLDNDEKTDAIESFASKQLKQKPTGRNSSKGQRNRRVNINLVSILFIATLFGKGDHSSETGEENKVEERESKVQKYHSPEIAKLKKINNRVQKREIRVQKKVELE